MSLAIGLSQTGPRDADYSAGVCFEDDGYYWFLYPYFERVAKQTGQMVDPYGDAVFGPEQLPFLLAALDEAAASADQQPEEWDVLVGWRGEDQVYCKVSKGRLQGMLADFTALVKRATATGINLVAFGD
jgi:hypothetical protein